MLQNLSRYNPDRADEESEDDEEAIENEEDFDAYAYNEPGSPPGTLEIDKDASVPNIFLIDYSATDAIGLQLATPEECAKHLDTQSVSWVDVQGLGSEDVLLRLGKVFNLHPLVLEDVVNIPQRPKFEDYEDHELIIMHMVTPRKNGKGFFREQVSLILGENYLLTVQEEPERDCFEPVRERIRRDKTAIRQHGADYLAYALIDAVVDGYFPVLEDYGERLEDLENKVVDKPTTRTLSKVHKIKRELLQLRRAIWPLRDAINALIRDDSTLISNEIRLYMRDCYDHTVQVIDMVETYRELASNLMDVYLSSISNRTNEIMRVLTIISTIFIPLTFIAGVYGMNFDRTASPTNMPELGAPYGYVTVMGLMLVIASLQVYYFYKKGWIMPSKK